MIETALAGKQVDHRRSRAASGTRWSSATRVTSAQDEESIRDLLVAGQSRRAADRQAPRSARSPLAEVADVQVVEGPATIKGENGLLRNYVRLNVRGPRRRRVRRRGPPGRRPRGQAARRRLRSSGPASSSTQLRARRTLDDRRADRRRADLPDPLPDLSRPGRRRAHAAGRARARSPAGSSSSGCWAEALGHGLGRLHRLLRHGDLDRDHHARLPARGRRAGRRPGANEPGRSCARPCSTAPCTGCGPSC